MSSLLNNKCIGYMLATINLPSPLFSKEGNIASLA